MHESLLVLGSVIVGTSFTCIGCYLGAYLVRRTYEDVTNPYPPEVLLKLDREEDGVEKEPEDDILLDVVWSGVKRALRK